MLNTKVGSLDLKGPGGKTFSVFPPSSTAQEAIWSPDSRRLFVVRTNFLPPQSGIGIEGSSAPIQIWRIWIQEDRPSVPALVFQSPSTPQPSGTYLHEQIVFGRWSPDNRYLLFWLGILSGSAQADGFSFWVLDVETGKVMPLADRALLNPRYQSWAPDGSALAFTAGGYRSAQVNKWLNLFNPATGQVTTVVSKTEAIPGIVAWSPRGDLIAYAAVQASDASMGQADWMSFQNLAILKRRVYLLNPQTGKHWQLNRVDAFQDAPTWSEDGAILYYVQREDDNMVLMAANPSTGQAQVIEGTRYPAPHAVGYYGQSDWDDLLAYRPGVPRAAVPSLTEIYIDPTIGYTLRYPGTWYVGQGWQYLTYSCQECRTLSSARLDGARPDFGPFSGKAFIAIQVIEKPEADLDAFSRQVLATTGPGQTLDRSALLTAFDQRKLTVDGQPAVRLETMGEFGEVNHVLVVLDGKRTLILRGQGDGRVFDAIIGTLKLR
ncbi:MAG: hypothetical protein AB1566_10500 [Chloroflexota bacterium]